MRNRKQTLRLVGVCLVAIGFLSSCGKDNGTTSNRGFHAIAEQGTGDGSRTYLDGSAVKWDENDQIVVRNAKGQTLGFGLDEGANTSYGTFRSSEVSAGFFSPNYTAIYPATSTAGTANTITSATTATFDLPAVQTYRANSFGTKAMPMMACSTDEDIEFKNVLGGVVFPLTCSQYDDRHIYKVKSVVITSNNPNDVLWGSCTTTVSGLDGEATLSSTVANNAASKHIITLDCGPDGVELTRGTPIDFIIMVPAGTLESGFTVKVVGDVYWPSAHSSAIGETIYERSVAWSSGQMPDFIVRSRLSKVLTAMDMVPPPYYTVNYIDFDTGEMLAAEKLVWPVTVGATVTETAIPIWGYMCLAPCEVILVISESQNEIIFYYEQDWAD
ncbi:MAG: hypothetical protein IKW82_02580 [Bacteroidales bacterium]|nr:hypothetical protein [Bacteroidales bacterium]